MISYGTAEAVERLVDTYGDLLLRLASSRLRGAADAQDAVQEVFLYLLEHEVTFKSEAHEKAWLIRVTVNVAKNMLKAASHTEPLEENTAFVYEEYSETLNAVLSLPLKYRTVLHLYYYEGYSIKEIAAILEIPSATVGTILARGREKLRATLQDQF